MLLVNFRRPRGAKQAFQGARAVNLVCGITLIAGRPKQVTVYILVSFAYIYCTICSSTSMGTEYFYCIGLVNSFPCYCFSPLDLSKVNFAASEQFLPQSTIL